MSLLWIFLIDIWHLIAPYIIWGLVIFVFASLIRITISYIQQIQHPLIVFRIKPPYEFTKMPFIPLFLQFATSEFDFSVLSMVS